MFVRRFEGFAGGRDDAHVHRRQIEIALMRSTQICRDVGGVAINALNFELIVKVWEGRLQAGTHAHPCISADWFGHRPAEFEIVGEQGFCSLEIAHLDGVYQRLNSFFCVHKNFLYL